MIAPSPASFSEALVLHQRGELAQAEQRYRALLALEPNHTDALHLLGVLALQSGQAQAAITLMKKAIAFRPSIAAYHSNLAEAYRAVGEIALAIASAQLALRLQPIYPDAVVNLGSLYMSQGRIGEAAEMFRRAIEQKPDFAVAHNNLGNALRLLGDIEQAVLHFRKALELQPHLGFVHGNLGQLLLEGGQLADALRHCQEAVRLQPNSAPAFNNLGNVLRHLGRLAEAKGCYSEALRRMPNLAMSYHNLGEVEQDQGKGTEAHQWFLQALQLEPSSPLFHTSLAKSFRSRNDSVEAETHLLQALRLAPNYFEARLALGQLRADQGRLDEASAEFERVLEEKNLAPRLQFELGDALLELNQRERALECYRGVLRRIPQFSPALGRIASYFAAEMSDEEQTALRQKLAEDGLGEQERTQLLFALAQLCDARGDYQHAADHLSQAHALELHSRQQQGDDYNVQAHVHFVDRLVSVFTPELFARLHGVSVDSERPIFIIGLPRSGTTLLEQILASHSRVFGAGELRLAREGFESLGRGSDSISEERAFEAIQALDVPTLRALAETHLGKLQQLNDTAAYVTDKMPDNYQYVGFLALLFPKARFLHCRRDLRDVAVSCWITQFRQIPWTNDPDQIASRFTQYRRIMDHWKQVLPVPILDVNYEDMVENVEGVARRILEFCGLEWEAACLDFHSNKRAIRTASVAQVRQPIYHRSLARWRHYENALQPLFARLPASGEAECALQTIG